MPQPPSQTRIVNRALALIGSAQRIISIDEQSAAATAAKAVWDEARDGVLVDHPWNFAIARAEVAASADAPAFGYKRAFEIPGDWLRWLPPKRASCDFFIGEQEGRFILSDAEAPLRLRGIRRIEDVSKWSAGFVDCLGYRLAMELAIPVTALDSIAARMSVGYDEALRRAKRQDGLASGDRKGRIDFRSDWLDARENYD
ncbi:hypothetical protein FHS96_004984 [Sphingomonas zeicaulis]|uniref:hypothetical protein n=1 Tax=Sphingomonas zeicaulis TaxID=1632740 RepID=UPI003D19C365